MERLTDAKLIKRGYAPDAIGQQVLTTETETPVTVELHGISRQEWQAVGQADLNPEGMAFLHDDADYSGEDIIEINSVKYGIYRTYPTDDGGIELYYQRKVGDLYERDNNTGGSAESGGNGNT